MDKYFLYDPDGEGFETFATEEKQQEAAQQAIEAMLDNDSDYMWPEDTEDIVMGIITHKATKCDIGYRPADDKIDENGEDEDGKYWGDLNYICNYRMMKVK